MNTAVTQLQAALDRAMATRPETGGFPHLAEVLRQAGVTLNRWTLPACESLYLTQDGPVVLQGAPLLSGWAVVPLFDGEALVRALRADQAGKSTFAEFLSSIWKAGVVRYDVDFAARTVAYYGATGEQYVENYPAVSLF